MPLSQNPFRRFIAQTRPAIGGWVASDDPRVSEVMVETGLDFLLFDQEHGPGAPADLIPHLMAIKGTSAGSLVRIPTNDPIYLKKVLDIGVDGVMVPMVESAEEAAAVVKACRYPRKGNTPDGGKRGYAVPMIRASRYGLDTDAYEAEANDRIFIVVQIESAKGIENVEEIVAVPGIDCVFIGPNDLAGGLGHFGETGHPDVAAAISKVEAAAARNTVTLGAIPRDGVSAGDLIVGGYKILPLVSDVLLLREGVRAVLADHGLGSGY